MVDAGGKGGLPRGRVIPFPRNPARPTPGRRGFSLNLSRLAVLLVVAYLTVVVGAQLVHLAGLRLELARTLRRVQQVETANAALREQIAYASTDEYVEQAARQLGLTRPGEILYSTSPSDRKLPDH